MRFTATGRDSHIGRATHLATELLKQMTNTIHARAVQRRRARHCRLDRRAGALHHVVGARHHPACARW